MESRHSQNGATPITHYADVIKNIWHEAKSHLGTVDGLMHEFADASDLLGEATAYQLQTGGKRGRPLLLLAAGIALRADRRILVRLAAATEMLHNASLVHDDLQDRDQLRRGQPTVWCKYGDDTAINVGDHLISSTYVALSTLQVPQDVLAKLIAHFAQSSQRIIHGQSVEIEMTRRLDCSVETYRQIAAGKSGVMLALPVVSVLLLEDLSQAAIRNAVAAMENLGIAYQIQDDLDDLFGLKDERTAGTDLLRGRMSLPILHFYQDLPQTEQRRFKAFLETAKDDQAALGRWVKQIQQSSALTKCLQEFDLRVNELAMYLQPLPEPLCATLAYCKDLLLTASSVRYRPEGDDCHHSVSA